MCLFWLYFNTTALCRLQWNTISSVYYKNHGMTQLTFSHKKRCCYLPIARECFLINIQIKIFLEYKMGLPSFLNLYLAHENSPGLFLIDEISPDKPLLHYNGQGSQSRRHRWGTDLAHVRITYDTCVTQLTKDVSYKILTLDFYRLGCTAQYYFQFSFFILSVLHMWRMCSSYLCRRDWNL